MGKAGEAATTSQRRQEELLLAHVALLSDNERTSKLPGAQLLYQAHPIRDF